MLDFLASARFRVGFRLAGSLLIGSALVAVSAHSAQALTINATFGSSITSASNMATIEAAINTAIMNITSLFSNSINVNIFFGTSALSGLGTSQVALNAMTYSSVRSALASELLANLASTVLNTAVASLPIAANAPNGTNAPTGPTSIALTSADFMALGGTPGACVNATGGVVSGCTGAGVYAGVVTLTNVAGTLDFTRPSVANQYDAIRVTEHEIDEVLGIGGPGSMLGTTYQNSYIGATDLYRYSAAGTFSYTTSSAANSYFSVNGGLTSIVGANQTSGGDYADFASSSGCPAFVQDAFSCPNQAVDVTRISPEAILLQAIGYQLKAVPEPTTMAMLGLGLVALPMIRRRRKL